MHVYVCLFAWTDHLPYISNEHIRIFRLDCPHVLSHENESGELLLDGCVNIEEIKIKMTHVERVCSMYGN